MAVCERLTPLTMRDRPRPPPQGDRGALATTLLSAQGAASWHCHVPAEEAEAPWVRHQGTEPAPGDSGAADALPGPSTLSQHDPTQGHLCLGLTFHRSQPSRPPWARWGSA